MNLNSRAIRTVFMMTVLVAVSGFNAHSQTLGDVLERVRAIKLLETDQSEVRLLLREMTYDGTYENRGDFSYGIFEVSVYYSTGECEKNLDGIFESAKGKVTQIGITTLQDFTTAQLGFDISKLKKEQMFFGDAFEHIYHDKTLGLAVIADREEVYDVILIPSIRSKAKVCDSEWARDFVEKDSWFGSKKLEDRWAKFYLVQPPLFVKSLILDRDVITALTPKRINVTTVLAYAETQPELYNYSVTAGKVMGNGPNVVWDLTGVPSGTYTITAGVSDGCVQCGATVTKTIVIK